MDDHPVFEACHPKVRHDNKQKNSVLLPTLGGEVFVILASSEDLAKAPQDIAMLVCRDLVTADVLGHVVKPKQDNAFLAENVF